MCNLFALENLKILKKMLKIAKKLWGPVKTERNIFVKNIVSFFHLILWAFEIKNKKGKKKLHIRFAFRAPYVMAISKKWKSNLVKANRNTEKWFFHFPKAKVKVEKFFFYFSKAKVKVKKVKNHFSKAKVKVKKLKKSLSHFSRKSLKVKKVKSESEKRKW